MKNYNVDNLKAEYMDLKTLWDRANDAINTIIRREECSEDTAEFLQPCIEGIFLSLFSNFILWVLGRKTKLCALSQVANFSTN